MLHKDIQETLKRCHSCGIPLPIDHIHLGPHVQESKPTADRHIQNRDATVSRIHGAQYVEVRRHGERALDRFTKVVRQVDRSLLVRLQAVDRLAKYFRQIGSVDLVNDQQYRVISIQRFVNRIEKVASGYLEVEAKV